MTSWSSQEEPLSKQLSIASQEGNSAKVQELLQNGVDANVAYFRSGFPLHVAKTVEIAQTLLDHGANIECKDERYGCTPLSSAAYHGHLELVKFFLDRGADVNATNKKESTALHNVGAVSFCPYRRRNVDDTVKIEIAKKLLDGGTNLNARDRNGQTPLHRAARFSETKLTRLFLEKGAKVNAINNDGETPLHLLVHVCCETATAEVLLEFGAYLNAKNNKGETPLHIAASEFGSGKKEMVVFLVGQGADVNLKREDGMTPLHQCMSTDYTSSFSWGIAMWIANFLLEHNADLNGAVGKHGMTPLHWTLLALSSDDYDLRLHASVAYLVRRLLDHGADANAVDKFGEKPLHIAARFGNIEAAQLLVDRGGIGAEEAVRAVDNRGRTPLHLACKHNPENVEEIVQFLLDQGALASVADNSGKTPMHHVAAGDVTTAQILLDHGIDVNATNNRGQKPLHIAARFGNIEVAQLLLDGGGIGAEEAVCAVDNKGRNPLHLACKQNPENIEEIVLFLLDQGASVRVADNDGMTALHVAAAKGLVTIARILLDQGAVVNAKNIEDETPLHWCLLPKNGKPDIGTAQLLLDRGADVNAVSWHGHTPLHAQMLNNSSDIVELLLERGGKVNAVDRVGETPLHKAVGSLVLGSHPWEGDFAVNPDVVKLLLDHGAKLEATDCVAKTPLHYAAWIGDFKTVQMLVEKGASTATMDMKGDTPLQCGACAADRRSSRNVVRFLLEQGEFFFCVGEARPDNCTKGAEQLEAPDNNRQTNKPKKE